MLRSESRRGYHPLTRGLSLLGVRRQIDIAHKEPADFHEALNRENIGERPWMLMVAIDKSERTKRWRDIDALTKEVP